MPDGLGERLKAWLDTLEEEGAEADELTAAYNAYLRYLELVARTYPELDEGEQQSLALRQAELDWSKERFGLEQEQQLATEQVRLSWQQQQARLEQEQAWLPYQQMTAYQQSQARQSEMQYAAQLAALGEEGWIQSWYANQAQQAQFESKPWYTQGGGLAGIAGWESMKPEERGEWKRRYEYSQWARLSPDAQRQVTAGYGFPQPSPGQGFSLGAPVGERIPGLPVPPGPQPIGEAPPRKKRPISRPTAPPTPEWLPQFAPWLTAGQPISRGQLPTPSGQLLSRTPPSVLAGLKGFTQWKGAGRSLEDILAHAQQMQPRRPWGGQGIWGAARQI